MRSVQLFWRHGIQLPYARPVLWVISTMSQSIHVGRLTAASKSRKSGYLEAVYSKSKPDPEHPGFIILEDQDYVDIANAFQIVPGKTIGLGDLISKVATPIARALGMDCIDKKTNELKPESGCAKRKALANKIQFPK